MSIVKLNQHLNGNTTRWIIGLLVSIIMALVLFYGNWTKEEMIRLGSAQAAFVPIDLYQRDQNWTEKERRKNSDRIEILQKEINTAIMEIFNKLTEIQVQVAKIEKTK